MKGRNTLSTSPGPDEKLDVRPSQGGVTLRVRVQPRASRNALAGIRAGALVVRLTAPPAEGEANAALVSFIAGALSLPRSAVRLLRGQSAREKLLQILGASEADVLRLAMREKAER